MTQPPKVNQLVSVHADDSEKVLRSRIEESSPGQLLIAYPSDGQTAYRLPLRTEVVIEWNVERGVGHVTGLVAGHVEDGVVPMLVVSLTSAPVVNQRRAHVRADLVLDVEVWADPDEEEPVTGVTLDVSGGGMRAVLPVELEAESLVRVWIELPTGAPVEALARVVEQRDDGIVAFNFHEIVPIDRERLIRAVFQSYRTYAAVRRSE